MLVLLNVTMTMVAYRTVLVALLSQEGLIHLLYVTHIFV